MSATEPLDTYFAVAPAGIPERPDAKLDRVLDATEQCLARHGVRRTTMSDIAREMGVSRPTLYKQVGSVEEAVALVGARQLYAFLDQLQALLSEGPGPETFIEMAVDAVTFARTSPVVQRLLSYEPDLVGGVITSGRVTNYIQQVVDLVTPLLQAAMDTGAVRATDPRLTAETVVRLCGSLMLAPTTGDLDALVRCALEPILVPPAAKPRKALR